MSDSQKRPGNPKTIERMWAFVARDRDGDEGVAAFLDPVSRQWHPLIAADTARLDSLKQVAQRIADETGEDLVLVEFHTRTEHETFRSRNPRRQIIQGGVLRPAPQPVHAPYPEEKTR